MGIYSLLCEQNTLELASNYYVILIAQETHLSRIDKLKAQKSP